MIPKDVKNSINRQLPREIGSEVKKIVFKQFDILKMAMVDQFLNHPVTVEIQNGVNASNTSNTLGGYGNLYTFIGFPDNYDPIQPIEDRLMETTLQFIGYSRGMFQFTTTEPTREEIFSMTKISAFRNEMTGGRSWVDGIETGLSGLGYYLYKKGKDISGSRSGPAIQLKGGKKSESAFGGETTGGAISKQRSRYKRTSYLSSILKEFQASLNELRRMKL